MSGDGVLGYGLRRGGGEGGRCWAGIWAGELSA